MPNLRELLQNVKTDMLGDQHPLYPLLEALVEAVEPEKHTCGECIFYNLVRGCTFAWPEGGKHEAHASDEACGWFQAKESENTELATALAEIPRLEDQRDSWERQCRNAERGLAKAKTEIDRLRKERDERALLAVGEGMMLADARETIGSLRKESAEANTDAEIGRLVRGMRSCTRLIRGYVGTYWSDQYTGGDIDAAESWVGALKVSYTVRGPAEALRAIQKEVGDG